MTTTVKIAADGKLTLPEVLRKNKRLKAGTRLRVTEAGENILLTPVYGPSQEELASVIETCRRARTGGNAKESQTSGGRN